MKFSLLVPTRSRIVELQRMLASLSSTVHDKTNLEVLIGIDNDDEITKNQIQFINVASADLNIKYFYRNRSDFINRDYYNWLASFSTGKYLCVSGDDLVYMINGWDKEIEENIEQYLSNKPDRIMCGGIQDNTPKPNNKLPPFPCFPLVTKEAYNTLGFVLHPEVPTWGADYLLYVLYTGVDRYLPVLSRLSGTFYLNHVSYHTRQCESDATNIHVGNTFNRLKMRPEHNVDTLVQTLIPGQLEFLRNYIRNYRSEANV